MTNCAQVEPLLSAWLDGALSPSERLAVGDHLARCPRCRGELETLRITSNLLRSVPARALPAGLQATMTHACSGVTGEHGAHRRSALAAGAAAAALLAGLLGSAALAMGGDPATGPAEIVVPLDAFVVDHVSRAPQVPGTGPLSVEVGR
jgi:anti-sigma factor RsiW